MRKVHTRIKRKFGLSTHLNQYSFFHPGIKKHRPKTFKTEESANAWALNHGLKPEQYYLKQVKKGKKFQIMMQDGKNKNTAGEKSSP
jgi:hypothetical protein